MNRQTGERGGTEEEEERDTHTLGRGEGGGVISFRSIPLRVKKSSNLVLLTRHKSGINR